MSTVLKTERLIIKPYSENDRTDMLFLLKNESIRKTYMLPKLSSPEEENAMFEKLLRWSLSDEHYERGIYFDGRLIGFLNDVETDGGKIELGYVIDPEFSGNGFATEALSAAISELFEKGFEEVSAAAFEDNYASRRVMEKCKMKLSEKTEEIFYSGKKQKCVYYSIKK